MKAKRQMTYKKARSIICQRTIVPLPPEVLEEARKVVAEYPARHEAYLERKRNYPTKKDAQWAWDRLHTYAHLTEGVMNWAKEILSHFEEPIITERRSPFGVPEFTFEWKRKPRAKKEKQQAEQAYLDNTIPLFED